MSAQPRDDIGRFGPIDRAEATVVHNGSMPSFSFPPPSFTAEEHLEYIMSAPVSERILSNAVFAYSQHREDQLVDEVGYHTRILNIGLKHKAPEDLATWNALLKEAKNDPDQAELNFKLAKRKEAEAKYPHRVLHPFEAETVVRAGWAYQMAGALPDEELAKLDQHVIDLGGPMTIREIVNEYDTTRWISDAVTDTDLRVAKGQEKLLDMLWQQHQEKRHWNEE